MIQNRGEETDEQMGMALDTLHQHGITEHASSDCEIGKEDNEDGFLNDGFQPPSSDRIYSDSDIPDCYSCSDGSDYDSDTPSHITSTKNTHSDVSRWPGPHSAFVDSGHGGSVVGVFVVKSDPLLTWLELI